MNEFKIETGTITISDTIDNGVEQTITFKFHYVDPIIVAYIATRNNGESIDVRVHDVTSNSCKIFTQEPSLGTHGTEDINYMIVEAGEWTLPSGKKIKAGKTSTQHQHYSGNSYLGDKITFSDAFSTAPVVIHQISGQNSPNFCSSAILSIASTGFEITQEKGGTATDLSVETINWIAFENTGGNFVFDHGQTVKMEVDVENNGASDGVDNTYHEYTFSNTYSSTPYVIAKMNSSNDTDGAWSRASATATNTTRTRVYAEEDQVGDSERSHNDESFGFVVFSKHIAWRDCHTTNGFKMEVGQVNSEGSIYDHSVFVEFQNNYINPVVVAFIQTRNNTGSMIVQTLIDDSLEGYQFASSYLINMRDVEGLSKGFIINIQNASSSLGANAEKISYIVVEAGDWRLPNGLHIQAGKASSLEYHETAEAYTGTTTPFYSAFSSTPILLHSCGASWHTSGTVLGFGVTTTNFKCVIEKAGLTTSNGYSDVPCYMNWIAIDDANGSFTLHDSIDLLMETKLGSPGVNCGVDDTAYVINYANTYSVAPIVIASQNTGNGSDGGWARGSGTNSTTQFGIYSEEDQVSDSERAHTSETFSFVVFESAFSLDLTEETVTPPLDYTIKISLEGNAVNNENLPEYAHAIIDNRQSLKEISSGLSDQDIDIGYSLGMPLAMSFTRSGNYRFGLVGTELDMSELLSPSEGFYRIFYNNTKTG
jgi:hypothetical protein